MARDEVSHSIQQLSRDIATTRVGRRRFGAHVDRASPVRRKTVFDPSGLHVAREIDIVSAGRLNLAAKGVRKPVSNLPDGMSYQTHPSREGLVEGHPRSGLVDRRQAGGVPFKPAIERRAPRCPPAFAGRRWPLGRGVDGMDALRRRGDHRVMLPLIPTVAGLAKHKLDRSQRTSRGASIADRRIARRTGRYCRIPNARRGRKVIGIARLVPSSDLGGPGLPRGPRMVAAHPGPDDRLRGQRAIRRNRHQREIPHASSA